MPVGWSDWPKAATEIFQGFRSPAGEQMVLEQNLFIEGDNLEVLKLLQKSYAGKVKLIGSKG